MLKRNTNLILKSVLIILLIILIALIIALAKQVDTNKVAAAANDTRGYHIETARIYPELEYVIYYDPEPTEELLSKIRVAIKTLELTCGFYCITLDSPDLTVLSEGQPHLPSC